MLSWINECTAKRISAKNSFQKNFYTLVVNANFGKTIERLENREIVKVCRSKEEFLTVVSRKTYKRHIIVNSDLVIAMSRKTTIYMNKPFYVGFSVLDISKYIMYFYYYYILKTHFPGDHSSAIYSDTDSFILKLKSSDINKDLKHLENTFDFSNLPLEHPLYDTTRKSKLFMLKSLITIYSSPC